MSPVVAPDHGVDDRPGSLNGVLTGEKSTVARDGVAEEPLVGHFLPWLFVKQVELPLIADKVRAGTLDPRGKGDGGTRGSAKAQIVGRAGDGGRIGEQLLRRRLQLHPYFGCRLGQKLA